MMNLPSECTIVSVPPDLEKSMEFSRAGKVDGAQSQVVKVWSINYTFIEEFKTPFIDTLEVEMAFDGTKTVMKNKTYTDVIGMDGGKDAVAEFGPVPYKGVDEAEIGYMATNLVRLCWVVPWYEIETRAIGGHLENSQCIFISTIN